MHYLVEDVFKSNKKIPHDCLVSEIMKHKVNKEITLQNLNTWKSSSRIQHQTIKHHNNKSGWTFRIC